MSFAVWQYHCDGFWQSYDQPTSDQIEAARQANVDTVELTEGIYRAPQFDYTIYEVMPFIMLQRNKETGTCRPVRRLQATIDGLGAGPKDCHAQAASTTDPLRELFEPFKSDALSADAQCNICISGFDDEEAAAIKLPKCQGHWYHADCIETWLREKQQCPYCKQIYGVLRGSCPDGHFEIRHLKKKLPGYNAKRTAGTVPSAAALTNALQSRSAAMDDDTTMSQTGTSGSDASDTTGSYPSSASSSVPVSPSKGSKAEYSSGTWMLSWTIPSGIQSSGHQNPGKFFSGTYRQAYLPDTPAFRDILKMFQIAWQRKLMFTVGRSLTREVDNVVIWAGIHCRTEWHNHGGFGWPCESYAQTVTDEFRHVGITPDQEL
ncbi:hypothetical protein BCR37DRAFT_387197 [Protomyces lactucae-debilis]|uniref:RING-type E3 ubiquitin transferase n=1 Tax=Protomyces lactucae-debilis TaxID=2754530 RepID=A0A1Y2FGT0_PROLT|nr:uncharacterized protein BCR37DRAFT_387197 [Protomyces lactucae-debilis]ORY82486.1 hypothetical protein BCR37DRAFT_387197 [Protomyces lactucae-debilis]